MKEQYSLMIDIRQQNKKQKYILEAIQQYQNGMQSQGEQEMICQNKQVIHQFNYQNKKILKIQPLNMYKDSITLLKQNRQKKQQVKKLQKLNNELRNQYETCLENNNKIQEFLKNRQFTFQIDNKISQGNETMLKAKRSLLSQAKETKQKMKKMFKDRQVSIIQQLKQYINVLENHEREILQKVEQQKQRLNQKLKVQDLSQKQTIQFKDNSDKLKTYLTSNIQFIKQKYQNYKKQKLTVKKYLKKKEIEQKKIKIKQQQTNVAHLVQQSQGLEYQIKLLEDRLKNHQKQSIQYESLQQKVQYKSNVIIKLQKQFRQKTKTYEYMQQWTKQLKKQLQQRKSEHTNKKQQFQKKINQLSQNYEQYNQKYKANLYEEQIAKKKGIKDIQIYNQAKVNMSIKPINYQQIKIAVKSLSFILLLNKIQTQSFIEKLLKNQQVKNGYQKQNKSKFKVKSMISIEKHTMKDTITLQQLIHNFQACQCNIRKEDIQKIARFIIEDGSGKVDEQNGINRSIAKQILRKILQRQLLTKESIAQAKIGLQKLLCNYSEGIRHQLKISGGKQQQINIQIAKKIFINYGSQPYLADIFSQLLQLYGWSKRKTAGFTKLQDFDEILTKINTSKYHQILEQFK